MLPIDMSPFDNLKQLDKPPFIRKQFIQSLPT